MATRCKTVEFVFATQHSTLNAGTELALTSVTVYLPESSKSFKSATLEMGCTDHFTASPTSATAFAMKFQLGASQDTVTVTDTVTHSGESAVHHISRDVTPHFTSVWTSGITSMTATASITVTASATNNHWAKLKITYEYDDTSSTHIKTIWYPIETTRNLLTNAYQTVGGALAIPAIKGSNSIIPEASFTVRQVWLELLGNQATTSNADFTLDVKLPSETPTPLELTSLYRVEANNITPCWLHAIWNITSSGLTAAQPFEAKATTTSRVAFLCGWVGITYEFAPSSTTEVWNSLMIPAFDEADQHNSTDASRKALHVKEFWIEEPGPILIQPSQIFAFYNDTAVAATIKLWATKEGTEQSARSFTNTLTGGTMVLSQRIDAGGTSGTASGTGISLARGRNRIKIHEYADSSSAHAYSGVTGFMIINYRSGKAVGGVGVHSQTRHFALGYYRADSTGLEYTNADSPPSRTPAIPETNYFLNAVAVQTAWLPTADTMQAVRIQAQRDGSEGPGGDGAGWANAYHGAVGSAVGNWLRWTTADCTKLFRRWTNDVDTTRLDVETPRRWLFSNHNSTWVGTIGLLVTYHAITALAHGTLRGTAGDGSGLTVNLSRSATGEKVLTTATVTGGIYSASWYDDTEPLVADVYEDESHMGRSAAFYAGE